MDIPPVNRVNANVVAPTTVPTSTDPMLDREAVAAVQYVNRPELMTERELQYRHDPKTDRIVLQIKDRVSGEVIDQIPPEAMLRLLNEIQELLKAKEPSADASSPDHGVPPAA
jgi:uncharacterized FlaG/YvyC family protein